MHFRHRWAVVEMIGCVVTERCEVCGKTRTRVRGPVSDSPAARSQGTNPAVKSRQRGSETHREALTWMLCGTEQRLPPVAIEDSSAPRHRNENS